MSKQYQRFIAARENHGLPSIANKIQSSVTCVVEFSLMSKRRIVVGEHSVNPIAETVRAPFRSDNQPIKGDVKVGTAVVKKMSPAPTGPQPNVFVTKTGSVASKPMTMVASTHLPYRAAQIRGDLSRVKIAALSCGFGPSSSETSSVTFVSEPRFVEDFLYRGC